MSYRGESGDGPEQFNPQEHSQEEVTQIISGIIDKVRRGGKIPDDLTDMELNVLRALGDKIDTVADLLGTDEDTILKKLGQSDKQGGGSSFLRHIQNMFNRRN